MDLVIYIDDSNYHPLSLQFIKEFPVLDSIYSIRGRQHTKNGLGYILDDVVNPIMDNGKEPSFSAKRFRPVDSPDDLLKEIEDELVIKEVLCL